MKTFKKAMGVILSLLMIFTFALPAFADDAAGTITIENALQGETYKVYRLLGLESFSGENYSYKVNADWAGFFADDAAGAEYMTVTAGYVTKWNKENTTAEQQNFAKAALTYANTEDSNGKPAVEPVAETTATADGNLVFENLPFGYYLVGSSVGTLCELNTTTKDVNITDKNEKPTVDKKIVDEENKSEQNNAQIGDTVNFEVTVHAQSGAKNYVLHDTMSDGLTFNKDSVQVEGLTPNTDYKVITESTTDGCTFEVQFTEAYLNALTEAKDIKITYSAVLNEKAAVKDAANTNTAKLTYGDNSTVKQETKTYTYRLTVKKQNEKDEALSGATFTLSTDRNGTDVIKVKADGNRYVVDTTNGAETVTTPADGTFTIEGLAAGTYYLTETAAPAGYNKLAEPIKITIEADGTVTDEDGNTLTGDTLTVVNKTGALLPGTGGIGTTIFYVIGGLLMVVAAVLLITKKRMNGDK